MQTHDSPELRLFDCYAIAGTAIRPPLWPALTAADLLAEMDRCGVDEAMVHSAAIELTSPVTGNLELVEFCAASRRLHPVWCLLPPQTGEMPLADLLAGMKAHGVRTLSAYPDEHRFLLNGITFGAVFEAMIDRRIPLFVRGGGGPNWARITDLLREFPRLIVIAADFGVWGQDRFIRPLMERFEGLHIETSTLELDGGIPSLVARYGPDRILFGSGFHRRPMGGASLLLRNLDIAPQAKLAIAHGNLERLLEGSKP
jgi:hypothetical protein